MANLVLVGFMGAGKSTVGRLLAERLGWSFVDVDARIEREAGRSIPGERTAAAGDPPPQDVEGGREGDDGARRAQGLFVAGI